VRWATGRQGTFLAGLLQTCVSVAFLALLAMALWRAVGSLPSAGRPPGAPPLANLAAALAYDDLPRSFSCSGRTWRAAGFGPVANEYRLTRVEPGIMGHPVYRERSTSSDGPSRLLVPVGRQGPLARLYVWYEPE
jgi:hypothetical protein